MKKENRKAFCCSLCMLAAFLLWTTAIRLIDVQAIGPQDSTVGFATINQFFHNFTGVHMTLYTITDWLSILPLVCVMGFALYGLIQWIQRKRICNVDFSILVLGGFYIVVMAVFVLFEVLVVNYRPILIQGNLEASYPSSTTMLVMCVMPTALMQFRIRIRKPILRRLITAAITAFTAFMVIGRLICGVHWLTDIIGGALLSAGLVLMYQVIIRNNDKKWV